MTESSDERAVSRRNFMRNLAISALAATTAGTSAALISKEWNKPAVSPPIISEFPSVPAAVPAVRSAQTVVTAQNDASELLARLAESQAENMQLQAALQGVKSVSRLCSEPECPGSSSFHSSSVPSSVPDLVVQPAGWK